MVNLNSLSLNSGYRHRCRLSLLMLLILVTGCASSTFDYAQDVDFSRFSTVALAPDSEVNSLDGARIAAAASTILPSRGLVLAPPEQAALWLHYQLQTDTRTYQSMAPIIFSDNSSQASSDWASYDGDRHPYGWARTGYDPYWNGYGPDWQPEMVAVREQHLLLWLTKPNGSRVIWRSKQHASFPNHQVNGPSRSAIITQQVEELLANYPPPQTH